MGNREKEKQKSLDTYHTSFMGAVQLLLGIFLEEAAAATIDHLLSSPSGYT